MSLDALNIRTAPQAVILRRNDLRHEPTGYPYETEAVVPNVQIEQAPNPYPASTLFAGVGRDAAHAPTPLRVWMGGLAIPEWLSVMGWPFSAGKQLTPIRMSFPRGMQTPIQGRTVVDSPRSTSLGAMTTLAASSAAATPDLAKIAF